MKDEVLALSYIHRTAYLGTSSTASAGVPHGLYAQSAMIRLMCPSPLLAGQICHASGLYVSAYYCMLVYVTTN